MRGDRQIERERGRKKVVYVYVCLWNGLMVKKKEKEIWTHTIYISKIRHRKS